MLSKFTFLYTASLALIDQGPYVARKRHRITTSTFVTHPAYNIASTKSYSPQRFSRHDGHMAGVKPSQSARKRIKVGSLRYNTGLILEYKHQFIPERQY